MRRGAGWADIRDAAVLAATTLPLSLAVADVGVRSGVEPWLVLACSAFVFSAAVQLLVYQLATPQSAALAGLAWAAMALLGLRIILYSVDLGRTPGGRLLSCEDEDMFARLLAIGARHRLPR